MGEVFQGVLTNWLADAGILLGGLILGVLTYFRDKFPKLPYAVFFGLVGVCLLTVILLAFRAMAALPKETPQVNSNNVEKTIQEWLKRSGLVTRMRSVSMQDSHFAYEVTLENGTPITFSRTKKLDNYIHLTAVFHVPLEQAFVLNEMQNVRDQLWHEIMLEVRRIRLEIWISPMLITLTRRVSITNNLTEDIFMERLYEVGFALDVVRLTMQLGIDRFKENKAQK